MYISCNGGIVLKFEFIKIIKKNNDLIFNPFNNNMESIVKSLKNSYLIKKGLELTLKDIEIDNIFIAQNKPGHISVYFKVKNNDENYLFMSNLTSKKIFNTFDPILNKFVKEDCQSFLLPNALGKNLVNLYTPFYVIKLKNIIIDVLDARVKPNNIILSYFYLLYYNLNENIYKYDSSKNLYLKIPNSTVKNNEFTKNNKIIDCIFEFDELNSRIFKIEEQKNKLSNI